MEWAPAADRSLVEAASVPQASTAMRLGELLVRAGHTTQDQVNQALELQPLLHKRLGEILVEKKWAKPRDIAEALAEQFGLEFVDLTQVAVDPQATRLLQEGFAGIDAIESVQIGEVAAADLACFQFRAA